MTKTLIRNGVVVSGEKNPRFKADVVVDGDRIKAVEPGGAKPGKDWKIIEADGRVVCPGFIDPHSHADMSIYREDHPELLKPLIRQGITTFVGGNCGMGMAPISSRNYASQRMYLEGFTARELAEDVKWKSMTEYMDHVETGGVLLNYAMLAPHSLLRIDTMAMEMRHATNDEVNGMTRSLEMCMEAGCIGMSTGLQYMPGLQTDTPELLRLGRVLKKYNGIYTSHLRTYMKDLPRAVDELALIARENDIRAEVSHMFWAPDVGVLAPLHHAAARFLIKLSKYWTAPLKIDVEVDGELQKLERLRKSGVAVRADVMPSSTTFTHLVAYLPPWVLLGDRDEVAERFTNPDIRAKIRRDIEQGSMTWPHTGRSAWSLNVLKLLGWSSTIIMSVVTEANKHLEGKTIEEVGRIRGCHPFEAMMDLLVEEEARVLVFSALGEPDDNFTEQAVFAGMRDPESPISTDSILMGIGMPSHLFYGAFPKFFGRYVREKKMMDLETAVRKVTAIPAEHFNLKERGVVREGWFADLVVFDPETIAANCDFVNPAGKPSGIDHVFINGAHVVGNGDSPNGKLHGRLLRG